MLSSKFKFSLLTAVLSLALVGCDSSNDSSTANENNVAPPTVPPTTPPEPPVTQEAVYSGFLVAPKALNDIKPSATSFSICPTVPLGYDAIINQTVNFLDADDNILASIMTDACGNFAINQKDVPDTVTKIQTSYADIRLIRSIEYFKEQPTTSEVPPTSLMAENASYQISTLAKQSIDDNQDGVADYDAFIFSVTDTVTGKAVLGLNESDIKIEFNQQPQTVSKLVSELSVQKPINNGTSAVLVMDSSSSMLDSIKYDGKLIERYSVAQFAANAFLDNFYDTNNEAAVIAFSSRTYLLNDETLNKYYTYDNAPFNHFGQSGFTSDIDHLYLLTDVYNYDSELYRTYSSTPLHPKTKKLYPGLAKTSSYEFGGSTKFYDSVIESTKLLDTDLAEDKADTNNPQVNNRRLVIAFSDGADNSSRSTAQQAGEIALSKGYPIYAIGFDVDKYDAEKFQQMAELSGGSYKSVKSADDLIGIFQGISTSVRFSYTANLSYLIQGTGSIKLTIDDKLKTVEKELAL